jgi:hypothetical protein
MLLFVPMTKGEQFSVVVVSLLAFLTAMVQGEPRMSHVLLSLSAYMAVLVVFLANVAGTPS